ncbi:MAG: hypothetical protein QXN71_03120 [Candidatus Aenigmatarchaeota archaeon]
MTKWIEWERKMHEMIMGNFEKGYEICLSNRKKEIELYNRRCKDGQLCKEYSCWPECDPAKPLESCSTYFSIIWGSGSDYCKNPPNPNYQTICYEAQQNSIKEEKERMKKLEELYASGNSVPLLIGIEIGCFPYVSPHGCDPNNPYAEDRNLRIGIGFDAIPIYENYPAQIVSKSFNNCENFLEHEFTLVLDKAEIEQWKSELKQKLGRTTLYNLDLELAGYNEFIKALQSKVTKNHPVLVAEEGPGNRHLWGDNGRACAALFRFTDYNSKEIYIMIHNLGTKKREFLMTLNGPTGVSQQEYQKWLNQPDCDHPYECTPY